MQKTEAAGSSEDSSTGSSMLKSTSPRDALDSRTSRKRGSSRLRANLVPLADNVSAPTDRSDSKRCKRVDGAEAQDIGMRLRSLSLNADVARAEFLEALARFDDLEGWRATGARNCSRWMMTELGLCRSTAYREWKFSRELRELPIIAGQFAEGKLNWCKVRALLRVATSEDDQVLATLALERDADEVQRFCDEYRFGKDPESDAERDQAQRERRSVSYSRCADGSLAIYVVLPPEDGALLVRAIEHREEHLPKISSLCEDDSQITNLPVDGECLGTDTPAGDRPIDAQHERKPRITAVQRRADALVAVANASLGNAGLCNAELTNSRLANTETTSDAQAALHTSAPSANADRHMVVTHIDVEALVAAEQQVAGEPLATNAPLPAPLRAAIAGILGGSISPATARRLACQSSLVTMILENGEPIAVGRRHRLHTTAQRRAIIARDGGCTFPGCGATRHLDVHHVTLWRDGGETSVRDGLTLCSACHVRVHDEGWRITRVPDEIPVTGFDPEQTTTRTRDIVHTLDKRRSRFRFELPGVECSDKHETADNTDSCAEARGSYRIGVSDFHTTGDVLSFDRLKMGISAVNVKRCRVSKAPMRRRALVFGNFRERHRALH